MKKHTERLQENEGADLLKATGSRINLRHHRYYQYIEDLLSLDEVQELKKFRHHILTNRFQHSLNVSYYHYQLCRLLHLDAKSAARAGLLHDLYFYDTKQFNRAESDLRHAHYHPQAALHNASRLLSINPREQDMIVKHMWPVTPQRPAFAETYLLTFVDKYCAVIEVLLLIPRRFRWWLRKIFFSKSTVT